MTPAVAKNEENCGKSDSTYCFLVIYAQE